MEDHPGNWVPGCSICGTSGDVFYCVMYSVRPVRSMRKRHSGKDRTAVYCRACFEREGTLHLKVGNEFYSLPKFPRVSPEEPQCVVCKAKVYVPRQVYGMLTSTLVIGGSTVEHFQLGYLCAACVGSHEVSFPSTR